MKSPAVLVAARDLARAGRRFTPYLRGHRKLVAVGFVGLLLEVLLRLAEPWPLKYILDFLVTGEDPGPLPLVGTLSPGTLLAAAAIGAFLATALRAGTAYASTVAFAFVGNRVLTKVRADLYDHLQRLSLRFHSRTGTGELVTRLTGDVSRVQEVVVTAALPLAANVLTLVGMVVVMLLMNAQLAVLALAVFPLFAWALVRRSKQIRTVSRKQRDQEGKLAALVNESLGAMALVQTYGMQDTLTERFGGQNEKSMQESVQGKRLSAGLERITDLLVAVSTALVLYFGAQLVLEGSLSPGDLVVFTAYLKNAFKPMRDLAKYTARMSKAAASAERITALLDVEPEVKDPPGTPSAPPFEGEIRFEGVHLSHGSTKVLSGIDLTIHPGERVALVGPSGAGKSSLAALLLRLYDPDTGSVKVDGVDIREWTTSSVRSQMAAVLQESVLFAVSVRENVEMGAGRRGVDVEGACRRVGAHDFISALPDGYDTVVGERGGTLSGGQRQRVAIARAAVRDPRIVVLDEPTTGLDAASAGVVEAALERLSEGRTTLHVTHDPAAASKADRIVYMSDGKVVESGTHEELLDLGGRYAKSWELHRLRQEET